MKDIAQQIRFFRNHIPDFACKPGCHDCCGPVTTSTEEISRLPVKSNKIRDAALAEFSCPHLGESGCQVYAERPLICRLFGTTLHLACPHGMRPVEMINPRLEQQIHGFFAGTRHVLV